MLRPNLTHRKKAKPKAPPWLWLCLVLAMSQTALGQPVEPAEAMESTPATEPTSPAIEAPPVLDEPGTDLNADSLITGIDPAVEAVGLEAETAERWTVTWIFLTIWNAELFSAGGSPIVLNQLVLALLIILLGIWISKRIARVVRFRLSRIQRIDSHAAAVVQTIVFNTLVVIIVLAAMPIAGIPTTIFTVLGGAVAIGIGFGAQNLFNNLISGLIIMLERPIRLGDIVQAGEHEGTIDAINNRCTHIRRSDGVDILVPNSHFLEQPVINWTLSNKTIRGSVVVGVAYGSPTDAVAKLLRQSVDEHTLIHDRPEPIVLFQEFGDNALVFEVFFWANIRRPMDLRKIQSDVRFRVDELCRESHISIAYPQRDIHLDTLKPLDVRVVQAESDAV
jgi:small-conductance mechanosensitive channel